MTADEMVMDEDRLLVVLADLRDNLAVDVSADANDAAVGARRWYRPMVTVAAAIVAALALLAVQPVRDAVADWFGIGSTEIHNDGSRPPMPTVGVTDTVVEDVRPSDTVTSPTSAPVAGAPGWVSASDLGLPDRSFVPPEEGTVWVWSDSDTSLWVRTSPADPEIMFGKYLGSSASVQRVEGLGANALAVTGDHVLSTPGRVLAAENVVLWVDDDLELRLEGDQPVDELVRLARQLSPE